MISACDKALKEKEDVIEADTVTITDLKNLNGNLHVDIQDKEDKLSSPLRNPFLMAGVGAVVGLLVGNPITIGIGLLAGLLIPLH